MEVEGRSNVYSILNNWQKIDWSLQGFGMLRCRINDRIRIHVWSHELATKNVSSIHTHPWNFESTVMSGFIVNNLFIETKAGKNQEVFASQRIEIITGTHGKIIDSPVDINLEMVLSQKYIAGKSYKMDKQEIHRSVYSNGAVSVMIKEPTKLTTAYSYFPRNTDWVSAKPRQATFKEVKIGVSQALREWKR